MVEIATGLATVGNMALNFGIMILSVLFFGGVVAVSVWSFIKYKHYSEFKCVIWGRDGFGQLTETTDKAGIFVDRKTKNKRFFMKKAIVGLGPDNVPYIQRGKTKIVYLLRTGLKNFQFIKPVITDKIVYLEVGEEDVNWAINAYDKQKKLFGTNMLLQYLPFIALAFTSIIILIMFIYFFKQFPVLKETAQALATAAQAFAASQGGTLVLT